MVRLTSLPSTATQATLGWVSALISVRYLAGLVLFAAYSRSTALGRIASSHSLLSGYQAIRPISKFAGTVAWQAGGEMKEEEYVPRR